MIKDFTVNELIEELKKVDGDAQVIISNDEEGNIFSSLTRISTEYMFPDGQEYFVGNDDGYEVQCLILWPSV